MTLDKIQMKIMRAETTNKIINKTNSGVSSPFTRVSVVKVLPLCLNAGLGVMGELGVGAEVCNEPGWNLN